MKEFFSVLRANDLTDPRTVARAMMGLSLPEILAVAHELSSALPETPKDSEGDTQFVFLGDSEMVGARGGCIEWNCRLRRATEAARFAALYCDRLYIPDIFSDYPQVSEQGELDSEDEASIRYRLVGDILHSLCIKPCLTEGIVRYVKTQYHFCRGCAEKLALKRVNSALRKGISALEREYLPKVTGTFEWLDHLPFAQGRVIIKGPAEFIEHANTVLMARPPDGVDDNHHRPVRLTADQLRSTGAVQSRLHSIAADVAFQHLLGRLVGTSYLSSRRLDARLMELLDSGRAADTSSLERALTCELPFIRGARIADLLKLRRKEEKAFAVCRYTLSSEVRKHVASRGGRLDVADAKALYRDVVAPELARLDLKVSKAANGSLFAGARDLAVVGGLLSMGVLSGVLHGQAQEIVGALGVAGVGLDVARALTDARRVTGEVRAHEWYYLWRMRKAQSKGRFRAAKTKE